MPRSRKSKLKRLERKYRAFVFRSLVGFLLVACLLFFMGFVFSTSTAGVGNMSATSPLLHLGFLWTGLILIEVCGKFFLGTLRAQAEKRYGKFLCQLGWTLIFLGAGLFSAFIGVKDYLA